MVHTVAGKSSVALSKRQRRKTGKPQNEPAEPQAAVTSDSFQSNMAQLEPHNSDAQQTANTRLNSDAGAACASTSRLAHVVDSATTAESSVPQYVLPGNHIAAASGVQTLALQPTLRLAGPSTGWPTDSIKVADRVASLLGSFGALQVSQELTKLGYPELVGQRACLEVHLVKQQVDVDSCVHWIKQQGSLASLNRSLNPLELIKYQDLAQAASKLLERVPGITHQTAQIAIQQTLGDIDAAAAFLKAAMNKSHLPNTGDPNAMASLLLQNLPPGFSLPANSGEVVQAMAVAMAKANELQLATDRLAAAAIQSQQQIKAAMVTSQLPMANTVDSQHAQLHQLQLSLPQQLLHQQQQQLLLQQHQMLHQQHQQQQQQQQQQELQDQPQDSIAASVPQQASSTAAEWQKEKQEILVTMETLEKHKDWADKKIGQLIKRVTEAERPQKDEAYRLRDEVQKLRQEKDVLEGKLKEFERSLQKLKDCTYQEATQKREYERRVQAVQADLRGAILREQEVQVQLDQEASSTKAERRKREAAERLAKTAAEDKAGMASALAEAERQVAQAQAGAKRQERLAEERLLRAEEQVAALTQARQELDSRCELLAVEKASLASGLEDKEGQVGRLQQDQASLQGQVSLCHHQVAQLQAQLLQSQQALAAKEQQTSFYSHWTGGSGGICGILDASDASRSPSSTSPPTPLAAHPQPPMASAQTGSRSPDHSTQNGVRPYEKSPVQNGVTSPQYRLGQSNARLVLEQAGAQHGIRAAEQMPSGVQSPIGPRNMTHRKSSSLDMHQAPHSAMLTAFGSQQQQLQQPTAPARGSNFKSRSSHRPHHAQHTLPTGPGAMSSLLGLNGFTNGNESAENGPRGLRNTNGNESAENGLRGLRNPRSLQHKGHSRTPSRAGSFAENGAEYVLSSGSQDANGIKNVEPSWMQGQLGLGGHHGNTFDYNVPGLAQQVDAFHRHLHS